MNKRHKKYKVGDMVWCECYSWVKDGEVEELRYVGPACIKNIVPFQVSQGDYHVRLPKIGINGFNSWEIKEDWVLHEL